MKKFELAFFLTNAEPFVCQIEAESRVLAECEAERLIQKLLGCKGYSLEEISEMRNVVM